MAICFKTNQKINQFRIIYNSKNLFFSKKISVYLSVYSNTLLTKQLKDLGDLWPLLSTFFNQGQV